MILVTASLEKIASLILLSIPKASSLFYMGYIVSYVNHSLMDVLHLDWETSPSQSQPPI